MTSGASALATSQYQWIKFYNRTLNLPVAEGGEELVDTKPDVSASWSTTGMDGEWLSARLRVVASGEDTGFTVELLVVLLADVGLDLTGTVVPDIFVLILNGSVVLLCSATCGDGECFCWSWKSCFWEGFLGSFGGFGTGITAKHEKTVLAHCQNLWKVQIKCYTVSYKPAFCDLSADCTQ